MSGEVRVTLQTRSLGPGDIADLLGPACVLVERRCEACCDGLVLGEPCERTGCDGGWVPDGTAGGQA